MIDVYGQALYDYYLNDSRSKLWIHNRYGPKEEMPIKEYFRSVKQMTELDQLALDKCTGKVLDIGAGAGSHTLALQQKGFNVTALEISPLAVAVMKDRGVENVVCKDIFEYTSATYDTLLLLMNGIGLAGTIDTLKVFLKHARSLLNAGGQIIFDSSNIAYLYEGNIPKLSHYYGEVWYQYEYKKQKGDWFRWLYVDQKTLRRIAHVEGYKTTILFEDEYDQYLVRLTI